MNKDKLGFSDLDPRDRILTVAIMVLSLAILVLAILQLIGVWEDSIKVYEPLMAVMMFLQAGLSWRKNKKSSYIYLAIAVFLVICAVVILIFG